MTLSTFDALFDSLREGIDLKPFKESKVVLVSEYDNPPLLTGEFIYDEETDTIYVGAGNVMQNDRVNVIDFLFHSTSLLHKPLARINTGGYNVYVPTDLQHSTKHKINGMYRYSLAHDVTIPVLAHGTATKFTGVTRLGIEEHEIVLELLHESEVTKNG